MSRVQVIVPPEPAVTLAEAKSHLRVTISEDDALIELYLAAAQGYLDGPGGVLGVALEPQTLDSALDAFPTNEIRLPFGPVVSVASVDYLDPDGAPQVVASSNYYLDQFSAEAWIVPYADFAWPDTMDTANAVRASWIAGTGTPPTLKAAILLLTGHLYANREAVGTKLDEVPLGVDALIRPWRTVFI
jgi:uncharacterized phiE125 gp8 family phage protein